MQLNKIEDNRDRLAKTRRSELLQYARANNIKEITHDMPALLMAQMLRARGLTNPPVPDRPLGQLNQPHPRKMYKDGMLRNLPPVAPAAPANVPEVNALSDLERQYQSQQTAPVETKPIETMTINELRNECKTRGIKLGRTDNMVSMREKIQAHGQ